MQPLPFKPFRFYFMRIFQQIAKFFVITIYTISLHKELNSVFHSSWTLFLHLRVAVPICTKYIFLRFRKIIIVFIEIFHFIRSMNFFKNNRTNLTQILRNKIWAFCIFYAAFFDLSFCFFNTSVPLNNSIRKFIKFPVLNIFKLFRTYFWYNISFGTAYICTISGFNRFSRFIFIRKIFTSSYERFPKCTFRKFYPVSRKSFILNRA